MKRVSDFLEILCDRTGRTHKALMLMPKADVVGLEQNLLCSCLRCETNRPLFSKNIIFT